MHDFVIDLHLQWRGRHQGSQAREAEALPCRRQISTSTTCGSHH